MNKRQSIVGVVLALLVPVAVWSADLNLPFAFQSGTPIRASEMNANFDAVKVAVAGLGSVSSGARLKTIVLESVDGYSETAGIWDDVLKSPCSPTGPQRLCVPPSQSSAFTDPACTNGIGLVMPSSLPLGLGASDAGVRYYFNVPFADGGYDVFPINNPSPNTQQLYTRGDLGCGGTNFGPVLTGPLGTRLTAADLARLSVRVR